MCDEGTCSGSRTGRSQDTYDWPSCAHITLIGKPGCHLCDDARIVVRASRPTPALEVEELSILDDPELSERYWEQIPVVLVDGAQHDFWRVDEAAARRVAGRRTWCRP